MSNKILLEAGDKNSGVLYRSTVMNGESSEPLKRIEPDHPRTIVTPQHSNLVPVWSGVYVAFQLLKKRKPRKKQVVRIS
jgi:hypothetical protein